MLPDDRGPSEGTARYFGDLTPYADHENLTERVTQYAYRGEARPAPFLA